MLLAIWHPKLAYAEFATVSSGVYRKPVVELEQSSLKGWSLQYSTILRVAIRDIICDRPKTAGDRVTTLLNCSLPIYNTACSDTRPNWCASHYVRHILNYFLPSFCGSQKSAPCHQRGVASVRVSGASSICGTLSLWLTNLHDPR